VFVPGKTLELHMGYGDDLAPMMLGEITALEPSFPQSGAPTLTVRAYDRSHRLRHDVPDRPAFRFMNDSLIATQIALESGLVPVVDPSPFPPHAALPRTAPDMAILKERAADNAFEVFVWWDRLYFRFPRPQLQAVALEWGRTLSSFAPRFSHAGMAGIQVVRGYNEDLALQIVGVLTTAALDLDDLLERVGEAGVATLAALGRRVVARHSISSPLDAAALARAMLQDILDGLYEASGSCIGMPELRAGTTVEVTGVGKRFSGRYRLTKVSHTLDHEGYRTEFEVNQRASASVLGLVRKATDGPPPHRRATIDGVVVGQVRLVDTLQYKVQVQLPDLAEGDLLTVSCTSFMAGSGRGACFLPEIGDQVVVAFAGGDIAHGYVLGCLYSLADTKPALQPGLQRIRSRTGHTISLDDVGGAITVEHPLGSSVTLAADGSVSVSATNGLTLAATTGDITLAAHTGTIALQALSVDVKVATTMNVGAV
jgi:phage baseplate assembly protein V